MSMIHSEQEEHHHVSDIRPREESKWYHTFGDFFNVLKAFIGTNYQALPYAFMNSGLVFGIVGVFTIATLTDYCCQLLVRCKHIVIEVCCNEAVDRDEVKLHEVPALRRRLHRSIGYGDVGRRAFGPWCYQLIQILVWYTQFATCIAYFIFLGNTIFALWPMAVQPVELRNATPVRYIDPPKFYLKTLKTQGIPMLHIDNINNKFSRVINEETCQRLSVDPQMCLPPSDLTGENTRPEVRQPDIMSSAAVLSNPVSDLDLNNVSTTLTPVTLSNTSTAENITDFTTAAPTLQTTATSNQTNTTSSDIVLPSSLFNYFSTAPDLKLVILFPFVFFLITSFIRKLRYIAPFSFVATVFLGVGASLVIVKLGMGFSVLSGEDQFKLVKFLTFPAFLGQLISAYEGIGCILPIESSMEDNYQKMPMLLHLSVYMVFVVLCSFGVLGYLRFGETTEQIIVLNFEGGWLIKVVDVVLIISVLFTYPLQCFPVIEIAESYIFAKGKCCGPQHPRLEYDEIGGGPSINEEEERGLLTHSVEASASQVSVVVPQSVPAWKRNLVRTAVTCFIAGLAIALRGHYADFAAFTGAIGCAPLAYIIPCGMYLKLRGNELSVIKIMWHWLIIVLAIIASLSALIVIIAKMAGGMKTN